MDPYNKIRDIIWSNSEKSFNNSLSLNTSNNRGNVVNE